MLLNMVLLQGDHFCSGYDLKELAVSGTQWILSEDSVSHMSKHGAMVINFIISYHVSWPFATIGLFFCFLASFLFIYYCFEFRGQHGCT